MTEPLDRDRWRRLQEIADGALELPAAERDAFVVAACAGDPALRSEVAAFLRADAEAGEGDFLGQAAADSAGLLVAALCDDLDEAERSAAAGRRIGPYRVVREIGRGGMGAVYLAERADGQFDQRVALKLIRRGPAEGGVVDRFLTERRILARLEHPAIARLLDGGVTEDGLPWFALELVEGGVPITEYCAARSLPVEERLKLFAGVCRAVGYAHRRLVVHRDLKPSNVLVTPDGQVKLVDFGIAKLLGGDGGSAPGETVAGHPLTPHYAAPEQVLGQPITTATDVYSLGVVLYELLTGALPHRITGATPLAVARAVAENEPERPSRAVDDARRSKRLRGDLDAVVLHALEKEPERRYRSVEALLDDLERHRAGRPIAARRTGAAGRALRFARRHKAGVAAAALVVLSIAAGALSTALEARRTLRAAARAEQVEEFVLSLFEVSDPNASGGESLTARELLERGAGRIDRELAGQPAMQAEMLQVVGDIYRRLGAYDRARPLLRRSVELHAAAGSDDPRLGEALLALADADHWAGDLDAAEKGYRRALELFRAARGEDHPAILRAESLLARLDFDRGLYERAEPVLRAVVADQRRTLGGDHPDTLESVTALARLLFARGAFEDSEPLFREVLEARRRRHGELHTSVSEALVNLASVRDLRGDLEGAEPLYREALAIDRKLLPGHPDLAVDLLNLANLLTKRGRWDEGEPLAREALAIAEEVYGPNDPQTAPYLHNLGKLLHQRGELAEAEVLARRAVTLAETAFGPGHEHLALAQVALARVLADRGATAEAEQRLRTALAALRRRLPAGDPRTSEATVALGRLLAASGRPGEAEPLLREAVAALGGRAGRSDLRLAEARVELGLCLAALGRAAEAGPLLAAGRTTLAAARGASDAQVRRADRVLASLGPAPGTRYDESP